MKKVSLISKIFFMILFIFVVSKNNVYAANSRNRFEFNYTGEYQTFVAPYNGTYKLEVWGAQGGDGDSVSFGGKGGYSKGYYSMKKGETLYIYVGGEGNSSINGSTDGGYNGGGAGIVGNGRTPAGGGGGATDIRTISGDWNNSDSLDSRIIVAGGGGGAGTWYTGPSYNFSGGAGGGENGTSGKGYSSEGNIAGIGGSQTAAGYASGYSYTRGSLGIGGNGQNKSSSAGGGGGGYYGGGGAYCAGAGGGSGYIGILESFGTDNAVTLSGEEEIPTHDGDSTMTGNSGNGFAKISVVTVDDPIKSNNLQLIIDGGYDYETTLPNDHFTTTLTCEIENIAWHTGLGEVTLEANKEHQVILMTQDGYILIYGIHPNLGKAKLKNVNFSDLILDFSPNFYFYEFKVPNEITEFTPTVETENGVTYVISDNSIEVGKNTILIEAKRDGFESTIYEFQITREYKSGTANSDDFDYSLDGYQEFIAPYDGMYKLEVWGASGAAGDSASIGGKGGYSKGYIKLEAGDKLYIYIGGEGENITSGTTGGGYNGGGNASVGGYGKPAGGGGGATDIRTVSGDWNDSASLDSRIIVAGGGGGGGAWYTGASHNFSGGAGGGEHGMAGSGSSGNPAGSAGTQTSAGYASGQSSTRGGFGYGGTGLRASSSAGGGGGGYYGGGGSYCSGGGGGSGYIGGVIAFNSDEAITIVGNMEMPTHDGTGTMTGNSGNGYAKISYFNPDDLDKLISITTDKGTLTPAFSETEYEYSLYLTGLETDLTISSETEKGIALILGTGTFNVPAGDTTYPVMMTNLDGTVTIYNIHVTRSANPSAKLAGFKVNGTYYPITDESITEYTVEIPTELEKINLELIKKYPGQEIPTDTIYDFDESTKSVTLTVWSEEKLANEVYTFHFNRKKTTTLKSLSMTGGVLKEKFDPNQLTYTVDMLEYARELHINATSWFKEAVITITEPRYIGPNDEVVTIRVDLDGVPSTTYTLNINRVQEIIDDQGTTYSYTGDYQTFIAPYSGIYEFEVWGASGADGDSVSFGGKGGYSKGYYRLEADQKVYIYVGGKGETMTSGTAGGGYNGGGNASIGSKGQPSGGGGGATDIRTISGTWDDYDSLFSRIIVAGGGGGGGAWHTGPSYNFSGGVGGGLTGQNGFGKSGNPAGYAGNQNSAGYASGQSSTWGGFGYGGTGLRASSSAGGGGGGYYGGGGSYCAGGGGGSSYIALLVPCDGDQPITIPGNMEMPTHSGDGTMIGNDGDGFARITPKSIIVGDAFLDTLEVNDGTTNLTDSDENIVPFETWNKEYWVHLTKEQRKATITATPKDTTAKVAGIGEIEFAPGETEHKVIVRTTDGATKTYTIHVTRDADDDASPNTIKFKNSHTYLCDLSSTLCDYTFNKDTPLYTILVPFQAQTVTLEAELKSQWQKAIYRVVKDGVKTEVTDHTFTLEDGLNEFEVEIISEDEKNSNIYTYRISRDDKGNNNLQSLKVLDPTGVTLDFNSNVFEYTITVPSDTTDLKLEAKPQNVNATVSVGSTTLTDYTYTLANLNNGLTDCFVTVTAENGNKKTTIIHIYKEASSNIYLSSLTITDQENNHLTYEPDFNKNMTEYTVNVGNEVTSVDINAIAEEGTVTGNGNYTLKSGVNEIEFTVTSVKGDTQIYKIHVVRAKNSNSNLLNVEIEGYTYTPTFNNSTKEYHLTVPKDVMRLNVKVTPEESTTTYTIRGNSNLISSSNKIVITSIAEDRSYQTFEFIVEKEISDNNYLKDIEVTGATLNETFDKTENNYTIHVGANVTSVDVKGILEDPSATIRGNGKYSLNKGTTTIELIVTSESGIDNTYTIEITRDKDDDTSLKEVKNNIGSEVTKIEDPSIGYDYLINVQYDVKSIEITGIPNSSNATIVGNKTYSLHTGENDITLSVTSEAGTTKNYKVRVVRDKSDNDDLSFLYVQEGGLLPNFNETTIFYEVKVPNRITDLNELHIEAITEDPNATFEILGQSGALVVGTSKEVIVRVTAEDRVNTKDYTLSITRQEETLENLALLKLETNRGELTPTFNPDTLNYTLEVENSITDITVTAEALSDNVTVIGTGTYHLRVGKTVIAVFVVGTDGVQRDYQIVVTRKKSSDATLSSLVIKSHTLSPKFNKNTEKYTIKTSVNELTFTTITPTESEATYVLNGNENFVTGENIVTIEVTAPDGETKKTYTLTVTKEGSKNNNLATLEVENYTIKPVFHKGVTFYAVEVPNNVNSVMIHATAEDPNAVITGAGLNTISTGENYIDIIVESESGTKKTYRVLVTKEASDNNYLASLNVSEGTLKQAITESEAFDKTINKYKVTVPNTVDEITVVGTTEDNNATVVGLKSYSLDYGKNTISIIVTSESGIVNVYEIEVTREETVSAYLTDLKVKDYPLDNPFDQYLFEYSISVGNEISSFDLLQLTYQTEDKNATVKITDGSTYQCTDTTCSDFEFAIGMNEVHIEVTASDKTTTEEYILYVNREMSTNNYLDSLTVNPGTLDPIFKPETLTYHVEVGREVDKITIGATTEDSSATITTGVGEHSLNLGENTILIKVKSSIGITRTYQVIVNRKKSDNNYLTYLGVLKSNVPMNFQEPFVKTQNEYHLTVNSDTSIIEIKATLEDSNATVSGNGLKLLNSGLNTFPIKVTSEDGKDNTYTIYITKEISANNYLSSLIPSVGTLDPVFNKEETNYTLNLANNQTELEFIATAESSNAVITGTENQSVPEGTSKRTITVTAEDGTIKTYEVTIIRETASEARLERLEILGYPFEFDPDTFEYHVQVSKSKKQLLESEITAIPKDSNATVNLMGDLNLIDGVTNTYIVEVIAKDGYTTQEYKIHITRDSLEYTIRSNVYDINRDGEVEHVIGMDPKTKKVDFLPNFENDPETLHIYGSDGVEITEEEKFIGSYMTIKLEINGYTYDELVITVRGDLNGDGLVTAADNVQAKSYVLGKKQRTFLVTKIADINKDGLLTAPDVVRIKNYILGKRGLNE